MSKREENNHFWQGGELFKKRENLKRLKIAEYVQGRFSNLIGEVAQVNFYLCTEQFGFML